MSVQRRVSTRRGSTTAPDPFGVHSDVNLNPNRSSSSRLTIVRVPQTATGTPTPLSLNEPPASPVLGQRRLHRRVAPPSGAPERVSFAFSSFGSGRDSPDHGNTGSSPSSSPRLRPSSPHLSASNPFATKPRLTPDQLVHLARQSTVPRPANDPVSPPGPGNHTLPATFTPLPDDIYLPFIDRPGEVSALISSPPDLKLFSLLAQTFRNKQPSVPGVEPDVLVEQQQHIDLPRDPAHWTYAHLLFHLTRVDRDIAPDFIWAIAARKCILSHSELLWERIKGALGVPPELDVDYNFLDDDQESPDTSDISDDEGRGARGHWSDWDEVMDSPIHTRKRLSMGDSPAASIYSGRRDEHEQNSANFRAQMDDKLQGLQGGFVQSTTTTTTDELEGGDTTIAPTPHGFRSPPDHEGGMIIGHFSPPTVDENPTEYLSIEPLLAPSLSASPGVLFDSLSASSGSTGSGSGPSANAPGDAPGLGLGDIAEGAEEEEDAEAEAERESATGAVAVPGSVPDTLAAELDDPNLISPSQIQGLRISTSPLPMLSTSPLPMPASGSNSFSHTTPVLSPISPLPPYPSSQSQAQPIPTSGSGGGGASQPHSRRSSFSSTGPFQRSESTGNLSASWSAMAAAAAASGGGIYGNANTQAQGSYAASVIGSDAGDSTGYISDGNVRSGGYGPLFVSNFARLPGRPTLMANSSSSKRSAHAIPHTRYAVDSLALHMKTAGGTTATKAKVRAYSHGASTRPGVGGGLGASLARVASLGGGGGVGHLSSSSSSSTSSVSGGNRKSWGETKQPLAKE